MARLRMFRRVSTTSKAEQGEPVTAPPPLGPMTNVVATSPTSTSIRLADEPPLGGFAVDVVRRSRSTPGGGLPLIFDDPATSRFREFTGLTPGSYTVSTQPILADGTEGQVTSVTIETLGYVPPVVPGAPVLTVSHAT